MREGPIGCEGATNTQLIEVLAPYEAKFIPKRGGTGASGVQVAYGMSQSRRAMVECIFGWGKQHGTMRKTKHRGIARVATDFLLNLIAYNLIRIPKLMAA